MNPKNYGLLIEDQKPEDYVFGASPLSHSILQEDGNWTEHLPIFESQAFPNFEPSCCVSSATLNCVEILHRRLFGSEINFAERWLAWFSGTTPQGNDPTKVGEYLRKGGTPHEERWPIREATSFDDFYKTPPAKLLDYAKQDFNLDFKHYIITPTLEEIKKALKSSPLSFAVFAWVQDSDGQYYKPEGARENHLCVCYGYDEEKKAFMIFDSYGNGFKYYKSLPILSKGYSIKKKEESTLSFFQWLANLFPL